MKYRFEFRPYRRKFKQPLATSHGLWTVRKGIIVRLTDKTGRMGFGEIAPLEWFGSESFEQALEFCAQLPLEITPDDMFAVPAKLPACQFAFESAWENVTSYLLAREFQFGQVIPLCGLLPSGKAVLDGWKTLWDRGYRTFKWKIGIAPLAEELAVFDELAKALPSQTKLRLDANGGLSLPEAMEWLQVCDRVGVEFLEQPLPVNQFDEMLRLSQQYATVIALDESVANLDQLSACYQQGWRGILVIKPAIAGSPKLLRQFCQKDDIDAVFSSVLETPIGRHFGLKLAVELSKTSRAAGFGVAHWFERDNFNFELETTSFHPGEPCQPNPQDLWKHLSNI